MAIVQELKDFITSISARLEIYNKWNNKTSKVVIDNIIKDCEEKVKECKKDLTEAQAADPISYQSKNKSLADKEDPAKIDKKNDSTVADEAKQEEPCGIVEAPAENPSKATQTDNEEIAKWSEKMLVIEKQTLNLFEQTISLKSVQNSVEYRKLDQQMGDIVKLLDDCRIRKAWDINLFYRKLYLHHVIGWIQSLAEAKAKEAENISLLLYKIQSINFKGSKKIEAQKIENILTQICDFLSKIQIDADAVKKPSDDSTSMDLN